MKKEKRAKRNKDKKEKVKKNEKKKGENSLQHPSTTSTFVIVSVRMVLV